MNLIEEHQLEGIPVFPLPDFVLFPNTLVPFHIFEPRYVQMMEDCLAGSRLVAITGLLPGWESDYYGNPPIHRVGCVGKVVNEERLEGGRLNIYVHGLARVSLREPHMERSYRTARGVLLPDYPLADPDLGWAKEERLRSVASELRQVLGHGGEPLGKVLMHSDGISPLTYRLSSLLLSEPEQRQAILELRDPKERCNRLVEHLGRLVLQLVGSKRLGELAMTRH